MQEARRWLEGRPTPGISRTALLIAAATFAARVVPSAAEIPEPYPKYTLKPVEEAYPAFARGDQPSFTVSTTISGSMPRLWAVMKDQGMLINSMTNCKQIFNLTGSPGDWLIVVQWHTPLRWHRWTRTDVRKYTSLDDETQSLSYFLVGGFGLWMPRLAFREELKPGPAPNTATLNVGVWYDLDDKYIGWPTHNLKRLTKERWTEWYSQPTWGYAHTVANIANGRLPRVTTIGKGRIQDSKKAAASLRSEL
mmetsp:Transcript_49945/g.142911  ORF Transcript_49945/g.142911 Transcript_49945/m.142911 type:complete len:251 (+) Transcript_49945:57-809(+)